jgi:hypothetical protein
MIPMEIEAVVDSAYNNIEQDPRAKPVISANTSKPSACNNAAAAKLEIIQLVSDANLPLAAILFFC